jgi:hypothetical protein
VSKERIGREREGEREGREREILPFMYNNRMTPFYNQLNTLSH